MSYHYGVPPAHYTKFFDPQSPHSSAEYVQYTPAYNAQTPTRRHSRNKSYAESPREGGWYSPAGSPPPGYDAYGSLRKDHVSYESRSPRYGADPRYTRSSRKSSQPVHIYEDNVEYAEPRYIFREPRREPAPPQKKSKHGKRPSTDSYFYYQQGPEPQSKHARTRSSTQPRSSPRQAAKPIPVATDEDALRAGIPAGYSFKHWDPTERPIILLGSVFDANSLGKWIYDWTVYHHGASTPIADVAGDLWLLLIKLAGKVKRAEAKLQKLHHPDDRDMLKDFIHSGHRLWEKFERLLKDCEYYMMKASRREKSKTTMGKNAGTEFVESIFGRDRHLESTEKVMNSIRLWNMRFDANCEDILRRPSDA